MNEFQNKNILVTGASRGIGEALALAYLDLGANVFYACRSESSQLNKAHYIHCDFDDVNSSLKSLSPLLKQTDMSILVNNSGLCISQPLTKVDEKSWDKMFNVNLKTAFFLSQLFAQNRIHRKSPGCILNILSYAAEMPSYSNGIYAATKSALANLTRTMAGEWAPYNIRINGLSPGVIDTEINMERIAKNKDELVAAIALHRIGQVNDVIPSALFLTKSDSNYISGETLSVSGGKYVIQNPKAAWDKADPII